MDTTARADLFFQGRHAEWALFDALEKSVRELYPQMQLRVMKTCIAFDDPKPFAYVSFPPKKSLSGLWLSISLREAMTHPRIAMLVPVSRSRFTAHIHLPDEGAIDRKLLDLIAAGHR